MRRKAGWAWLLILLALVCGAQAGAVWPAGRAGRRRGRSAHTVTQEAAPALQQMVCAHDHHPLKRGLLCSALSGLSIGCTLACASLARWHASVSALTAAQADGNGCAVFVSH